jgi:hypothetical protein
LINRPFELEKMKKNPFYSLPQDLQIFCITVSLAAAIFADNPTYSAAL